MSGGPHIRCAALLCTLLVAGSANGWAAPDEASVAEAQSQPAETPPSEEERAQQSEQARRLSHARKALETRRTEAAERVEAEQAHAKERTRLQESLSGYARRESYLDHERYWIRREYDAITRDPADPSAMARRGALARDLSDIGSQLDSARAGRDSASQRLDALRGR